MIFVQTRVVQHLGEGQRRGHYIALVKTSKGKWCQADDAKVFEVGSFHASIQRRYGFLLFVGVFSTAVSLFLSFFVSFPFFLVFFLFFSFVTFFFIQVLPSFFFYCISIFLFFLIMFTLYFPSLNFVFLFPTSIYSFCVFSRSPFAVRHGFCGGFPEEKLGGRGGDRFV